MPDPDPAARLARFQALESRRVALLLAGDFDTVEAMLAETLIYGHSTGLVDNKASLMAGLRNGVVRYQSIVSRLSDALDVAGDVVVTSGVITIHANVHGQDGVFGGRFMQVWKRGTDGWLLQALQATNMGRDE